MLFGHEPDWAHLVKLNWMLRRSPLRSRTDLCSEAASRPALTLYLPGARETFCNGALPYGRPLIHTRPHGNTKTLNEAGCARGGGKGSLLRWPGEPAPSAWFSLWPSVRLDALVPSPSDCRVSSWAMFGVAGGGAGLTLVELCSAGIAPSGGTGRSVRSVGCRPQNIHAATRAATSSHRRCLRRPRSAFVSGPGQFPPDASEPLDPLTPLVSPVAPPPSGSELVARSARASEAMRPSSRRSRGGGKNGSSSSRSRVASTGRCCGSAANKLSMTSHNSAGAPGTSDLREGRSP